MIPPKTVQDITEAARIEDVVGEFVALRRRGTNLIGLCPFHGEKTPSFNVNPARNIFVCFGCGKKGDSVRFLMEHESFSYPDALRWLAKKYNIEIEEVQRSPEQLAQQQLTDSLYIVNDFGLQHFQQQLFDTDEGRNVALSYFRQRGLREDVIRRFGLGYAPDQRDLLLKRIKTEGHSLDLARQVGLISQDQTRDFFRARVMFAIHNQSGKVAAFAGRTMSTEKTVPKYINSPETQIYVKNKTLYGAFQARNAIRKQNECLLVEGYMDVISLHQAGIENVVASSGTSLTEGQLQLIKRNTENLHILYDGDAAGVKAALRGLDLALEQDLNVRITLLPDGHDPDSYVQAFGPEQTLAYLAAESKDFILFKTNLLLAETQGDPIKKSGLVKDIIGSIARIPDPIKRSVYLKECAALLNVAEQTLHTETNKLITTGLKKKAEQSARAGGAVSDSPQHAPDPEWPVEDPTFAQPFRNAPPVEEKTATRSDELQERDIVRLLVQFGCQPLKDGSGTVASFVLADIEESLGSFDLPLLGQVAAECRDLLLAGRTFDSNYFIQHERAEVRDLAIDLLTAPWEYSPNWLEMKQMPLQNQPMPDLNFDADMRYAVDMFKLRKLRRMCFEINPNRIKAAAASGDTDAEMRFTMVQMKIKAALDTISKQRNIVVLPR